MKSPEPRVPKGLDPIARAILQGLQGDPRAADIVLRGGVALQHYSEHRATRDLDAWWAGEPRQESETLIRDVLKTVAIRRGLALEERLFDSSLTRSLELSQGPRKVFSFQIAPRDIALDPPVESAWSPVRIETFRDNLGAKMSALVARGAPRDFIDVREVCRRGLASPDECWALWRSKHRDQDVYQARLVVLEHLSAIEGRRPIEAYKDPVRRRESEELRAWVKRDLCAEPGA